MRPRLQLVLTIDNHFLAGFQSLVHQRDVCFGREKRVGNFGDAKSAEGFQSERDLGFGGERGMAAREDQPQPVVGEDLLLVHEPGWITRLRAGMLSGDELSWINEYHERVRLAVRPHVDEATKLWLDAAPAPATAALAIGSAVASMIASTSAGVRFGLAESMSAATPAKLADAAEVP